MATELYLIRVWKHQTQTCKYKAYKESNIPLSQDTISYFKNDYFVEVETGNDVGLFWLINQCAYAERGLYGNCSMWIECFFVEVDKKITINNYVLTFRYLADTNNIIHSSENVGVNRVHREITNFNGSVYNTYSDGRVENYKPYQFSLPNGDIAKTTFSNLFWLRLEVSEDRRIGKAKKSHYRRLLLPADLNQSKNGNITLNTATNLASARFWRFRYRFTYAKPWLRDYYFDDEMVVRKGGDSYGLPMMNCASIMKQECLRYLRQRFNNPIDTNFTSWNLYTTLDLIARDGFESHKNLFFNDAINQQHMIDYENLMSRQLALLQIYFDQDLGLQEVPYRVENWKTKLLTPSSPDYINDTRRYVFQGDVSEFRNAFYQLVIFEDWLAQYGVNGQELKDRYAQININDFPPARGESFPGQSFSGANLYNQYIKNEFNEYWFDNYDLVLSVYYRYSQLYAFIKHILNFRETTTNYSRGTWFEIRSGREIREEIARERRGDFSDFQNKIYLQNSWRGTSQDLGYKDQFQSINYAPVLGYDNQCIYDVIQFDNRKLLIGDWRYFWNHEPAPPPPPSPPPPPPPPRKPVIWDHTIHPLTAEEEDAEAVAFLELEETNIMNGTDNLYSAVSALVEERGYALPPSSRVLPGIHALEDEINPNDNSEPGHDDDEYNWDFKYPFQPVFPQQPPAYT